MCAGADVFKAGESTADSSMQLQTVNNLSPNLKVMRIPCSLKKTNDVKKKSTRG